MPNLWKNGRGFAACPMEEFIEIWQKAKSLKEVAEKTGTKAHSASSRAASARAQGVPLKYFEKNKSNDWIALARLARNHANHRPEPLPSEQVSGNGEGVAVASGGTEDSV